MYFCNNCNSILNITKKISVPFIKEYNDDDENVFIEDILNKNDEGVFKIKFNISKLTKSSKFKQLDEKEKYKIQQVYKAHTNKLNSTYFVCENCNYHKILSSEITIFESIIEEKLNEDKSSMLFKKDDWTLPRTKDFICPNKSCLTNKKGYEVQREAIFYRPYTDKYYLKYLCTTCNESWTPSIKI